MFEIFVGAKYRFMEKRRYAYLFSGLLVILTAVILVVRGGPREGIDFTGGDLIYTAFDREVAIGDVRDATSAVGLAGAEIQMAENNTQAIIRYKAAEADTASVFDRFRDELRKKPGSPAATLLSQEKVGPKIGKELERKAGLAILWCLILILGYIAWRFRRFSSGLGAVIALFHDIFITLGVMTFLDREITLTVVAAFLTLAGYSINDTIVVFDRVRENMGLLRRMSYADVVDKSVNQTLSRTILTGGSTFMTVLSLLFLGGPVIHDFALAMVVGILIGTYSSVYVASALALDISNWWTRRKVARAERPARAATGS